LRAAADPWCDLVAELGIRWIGDREMPDMGSALVTPARVTSWRTMTVSVSVCVFIFLYYWALFSDGKFAIAPHARLGFMYNSMIDHMSQGRFDVDPATVEWEGFTRDHHTYAYFGVMPALSRLPLLVFPRLRTVDFTLLSCVIAATIAAAVKLATVLRAGRAIGDTPYTGRVMLLACAVVIFGGAQVQYLHLVIYQESLFWASALAAMVVLLAFRWCVDVTGRQRWHLVVMAILAGVCLLTRVSTSIGLYAACGAIMLFELIAAVRRNGGRVSLPMVREVSRTIVPPSLVLMLFVVVCGFINYERWGNPLTFQDFRYYDSLQYNDPVFEVLYNYGYFSIWRIPFGLSYFFVPIWTIIGSDGHFLFRALQTRQYLFAEFPPATFLLSDMFLCFLAALGCAWLWRGRAAGTDTPLARLLAVGFAIPGVLMLMAIALTFRYRMEFYQCFEFLALFGLFSLVEKIARRPRLMTAACVTMVAVSIVSSHLFLVSYKIMKGGDSDFAEKPGWIATYHELFRGRYTGIDRFLTGK
jgi:hypothetical protein